MRPGVLPSKPTEKVSPTTPDPPRELERAGPRAADDRRDASAALARIDAVARLLDNQFEIPLIGRRVGLDPLLGLIPGGGDWVGWAASVYIIAQAARLGAPPRLIARMGLVIGVDLIGGYFPVVGDLFDAAYKANARNAELIREHLKARGELEAQDGALDRASRWGALIGVCSLLFVLASVPIALLIWWARS